MKRWLPYLFTILFLGAYSLFLDLIPSIAMDEGWFAFYAADQWGLNPFPALHSTIQYKLFFLYPMLCGLWFKGFGISLTGMRLIAVIFGALGCLGLYKLLLKRVHSVWLVGLGILLYATSNMTLVTARWGRPEGIIVTGLIWVLYFILTAYQTQKNKAYLWAGLLSGLMVLVHPYSIVALIGIVAFLITLQGKGHRNAIGYFILGGTPILALFLINMLWINWDYTQAHFLTHITERLAVASPKASFMDRVIYFWESYTLGIKRLYILLFELGILIWTGIRYRKDVVLRGLSMAGLVTLIVGLVILSPFRRRYFGIVMTVSIITTIFAMAKEAGKWTRYTLGMAVLIYFLNNLAGDIVYLHRQAQNTSYTYITEELRRIIPQNAKVATLIQFWIPLHTQFCVTNITDFPIQGAPSIDDLLENGGIDYVVYSDFLNQNVSGTTGEKAIGEAASIDDFATTLSEKVVPYWKKVAAISTHPFGEIGVYLNPN